VPVNVNLLVNGCHRQGSRQSIVAVNITPVGIMVMGSMWSTCSVVNTCSKEGVVKRYAKVDAGGGKERNEPLRLKLLF
jgi:hypothetical protein